MNYPTIGWLRGLFDAPPLEVPDHTTVASHSIDSRTLRHGDLFWAIRAQRDGHDFVADALAKGACAAVVNQEWFESAQAELLRGKLLTVGDTTDALQSAARHWRTRIQCNVIGITGSNGKTTTKDIATHLLGARFKTAGTAGNLNNELGVPLTLLGMGVDSECMILELGASRSGDIEFLCELCRPTHGLVTSIGAAHLLGFGSIETVAATKGELYDFIAESGTAYVPLEDARCVQESDNAKTRRGFGFGDAPADWTDSYVAGTELRFDDQGCGKFKVDGVEIVMTIPGRPAAQSALAAISIALDHGISPEQCAARMHDVHYTGRRADVIRTATLTIVDDSYNANPVSMRAALETLILLPGRRRVAILGDMNELGRHSEDYHRQLGRDVGQLNVHRAAFVGGESHTSHEEALRTGVESIHVDRVEDLLPELPGLMEDADLVLIKGSRTMNLEQVVDELKRRAS